MVTSRLSAVTLLCLVVGLLVQTAHGQMVDCTIQVHTEAIPNTNRDLLRDIASDLRDYVSNYNWGGGDANEKVRCTLDIFVKSVVGDNIYSAQMFIGSQRPIYKSQQNTAVVRLFDESCQFTYVKNRPLVHSPYTYSDLASLIDFYMYLIMGYDYDTYDQLYGTPMFQKAADIASLGKGSGQSDWQPSSGTYNRSQLIDEIMSPTYSQVRVASWQYHYCGLDSLALNPERGYANIVQAVETIAKVKKLADPRNIIIRSFFEAKYKELADVLFNYPDPTIYIKLELIDPNHQKTYEEYRAKKQ